jgi:hypothetical protein
MSLSANIIYYGDYILWRFEIALAAQGPEAACQLAAGWAAAQLRHDRDSACGDFTLRRSLGNNRAVPCTAQGGDTELGGVRRECARGGGETNARGTRSQGKQRGRKACCTGDLREDFIPLAIGQTTSLKRHPE